MQTLRFATLVTLLVAALHLAGCGGMRLDGSEPSIYRGVWGGDWNAPTFEESGSLAVTIFPDGSIVGQMSNTRLGLTAPISGTVQPDGRFLATAGFGAAGNYVLDGSLTLQSGSITGAYVTQWGGTDYPSSFTLTTSGP
jgi:hypothetical protein